MTARLPWRPIVAALAFGIATGVLGMHWGDALLLGLVAGALSLVAVSLDAERAIAWPAARPEATHGTRREVSVLTWSLLGRDGQVTEAAVRRLRKDATRRLARRGVVIPGGLSASTPTTASQELREQVRDLLGERTWSTLTARGGWMPSVVEIVHCVDVIERLATTPRPVPPALRGQHL